MLLDQRHHAGHLVLSKLDLLTTKVGKRDVGCNEGRLAARFRYDDLAGGVGEPAGRTSNAPTLYLCVPVIVMELKS